MYKTSLNKFRIFNELKIYSNSRQIKKILKTKYIHFLSPSSYHVFEKL